MLAFTFPGDGSARAGMGAPWAAHPSWELVEEASDAAGRDVAQLLLDAGPEDLWGTSSAQLSTVVLSLVVLDAVERVGLVPAMCAGHGVGELTALTATGALSFADGVRVVTSRGDAMEEAAEESPGRMVTVVGLEDDDVDVAARRADGDVWVAGFDAPGRVVLAGTDDKVGSAAAIARGLGATNVEPHTRRGAHHTPLMSAVRERLRKAVHEAGLRATDVPVVANVDARPHVGADEWEALLSAQLCNPVRWRQSVQRMVDDGVDSFLELGPGATLTALAGRNAPRARAWSVATPADLDHVLELMEGDTSSQHHHEGEHLHVSERLVVSPATGIFVPDGRWRTEPQGIGVGDVVGWVGEHEVRSRFAGVVMGFVALEGERVTASQPVAWLRVTAG